MMMYLSLLASFCVLLKAFPDGNSIPDANDMLPTVKTCAQTAGCTRKVFTDADKNARCFGTYACANAEFQTTNNVVCAGAATCYHAYQSGLSDRILCSGYKACERSQGLSKSDGLTAGNELICQGFQACTAINGGADAPVIRCDGDLTCSNKKSKIAITNMDLTAEDEIFCNGKAACFEAVMQTPYAYCDGEGACAYTEIQADEIECHGKRACAAAQLNPAVGNDASSTLKVQLFGWLAAAKSTIAWPDRSLVNALGTVPMKSETTEFIINAFGAKAMVRATVRNDGKEFVLNAFGYKATSMATLACSQAVPCTVNCKGNGCANLEITVAVNNDAYFTITPDLCDTANPLFEWKGKGIGCKPPKIAGVQCPYVYRKKGSYPQPLCTTEAQEEAEAEWADLDAEIDADLVAHQSEIDQYLDDMIADFDELEFLNERDDEVLGAFIDSYAMKPAAEQEEMHIAAVTMTSSTSSTLSTIVLSNLVTALSVVAFLSIALWCYVKCQSNKGGYKGLDQ